MDILFSEDNVDMIIEYILDLSSQEMKTLKLLISNKVTPYKALDQIIEKRTQKIEVYLRKYTNEWKNTILSNSRNICFVTGMSRPNGVEIHHVSKSFDEIVRECFYELNIQYRPLLKDYNPRELKLLSDKVIEKHKVVEGVALLTEVHQLFHREYGMNNNSWQQLSELRSRFSSGEFKCFIK